MEDFIDKMTEDLFGRSRSKSIKLDICIVCGLKVEGFRDETSKREYSISGMCQACQDEVF